MRATAIALGLVFSLLLLSTRTPGDTFLGALGVLAALLTWMHPRAGLVGFAAVVALSLVMMVVDVGAVLYAIMFAIPAWIAWRVAARNRRNAERAERMDRYVRHQLGE